MALTKQKKKRARPTVRSRRVGDMTTAELRAMIEALIDRKLVKTSAVSPRPTITAPMKRRAISAAGLYRSGHSDISSQHDDYLSASILKSTTTQ